MRDMWLAVLCMAGLVLGLQAVSGQIPVSFDHGKQHLFGSSERLLRATSD